jgi:hypothetical protein
VRATDQQSELITRPSADGTASKEVSAAAAVAHVPLHGDTQTAQQQDLWHRLDWGLAHIWSTAPYSTTKRRPTRCSIRCNFQCSIGGNMFCCDHHLSYTLNYLTPCKFLLTENFLGHLEHLVEPESKSYCHVTLNIRTIAHTEVMRPAADGAASTEVSAAAAVAHIFLWASIALLGRRRLHIKTRSLSHCLTQSLTNTHGECFDSRFQAAKMSCVRLSRWCKQQSSKAPSEHLLTATAQEMGSESEPELEQHVKWCATHSARQWR